MSLSRSVLPAVLLLATAPLASVASPAQAAEMCQGQPATIVWDGPPGGGVHGQATDGDDVIVVHLDQNMAILAGDGDDLICVTGDPDHSIHVVVSGDGGHDSLALTLGAGRDMFQALGVEDLDVHMGAGFDQAKTSQAFGTGSIDAGQDGGALNVVDQRTVDVDLRARTMTIDGGVGTYAVRGFDRVVMRAKRVDFTGNAEANGVKAYGCRVTLRGGAGDDVLQHLGEYSPAPCKQRVRILGQRGDDRLIGTGADDELIGGPGRDVANGGTGDDRCVAEKVKSCERS